MFAPETPLLETVVRVAIIYLFMLVLVRFMGKKEIGRLSPLEFLTMLLLARAVGPAMTNHDASVSAAGVAAATIVGLTVVLDRLVYRFRGVEKLIHGTPRMLIQNGRVLRKNVSAERLTEQQLASALRSEQVARAEDAAGAFMEPGGKITVIPKDRSRSPEENSSSPAGSPG